MHYAFIGLGALGHRLASRLAAFTPIAIHDRDPSRASLLSDSTAIWANSICEAVTGVDAVFTCLPSPSASRAVMLAGDGALPHMKQGAVWFELSTVGPDEVASFAKQAARYSVQVVDCPVTGGVHRAESGQMTMFVGADESVLAPHRDALAAMCSPVLHLGATGSAATTKLITNMLCLVDLIAASDAILLASKAGLDLSTFYHAVVASSGNSREFEDWAPRILDGSFDTGFSLALALKDLSLLHDVSTRLGVPLNLSAKTFAMLDAASNAFGDDAMTANVFRLMADAAGVDFKAVPVGDEHHG